MAGHVHLLTPLELKSILKRHQPVANYGKRKGKPRGQTGWVNKGRAASRKSDKGYYFSRIDDEVGSQISRSRRKTMRREKSEPKLTSRSYSSARYKSDHAYNNTKPKRYTSRSTNLYGYVDKAVNVRQPKPSPHDIYYQDLEVESNRKGWKNFGKKRKKRNPKPNVSYGSQHYQRTERGKRNRGQHLQDRREVNVQYSESNRSDVKYVASVERGSNHKSIKPKKGADHLPMKLPKGSRKSPLKSRRAYTDLSNRKQRHSALLIYEIPYREVEKDSSSVKQYKSQASNRKPTKPKLRKNLSLVTADELKRKPQKSRSYRRQKWDNESAFFENGKAFDAYSINKKILSPIETEMVSHSYIDDFMSTRTNLISPGAQMSFDPENNSTEISELSLASPVSRKVSTRNEGIQRETSDTGSRGKNPNPNLNIEHRKAEQQSDQELEDSLVAPNIDTLSEGTSIILQLSEVCDEDFGNNSLRPPVVKQNCEVRRVRSKSLSASELGSWGKPLWWSASNVPTEQKSKSLFIEKNEDEKSGSTVRPAQNYVSNCDYQEYSLSEDDEKSFVILKKYQKKSDNEDLVSEVSSSLYSLPNTYDRNPPTELTVHTNRYGVHKDGRKQNRKVVAEDQQWVAGIPSKSKRNTTKTKNYEARDFDDNLPLRPNRARESRIDNASVSSLSSSEEEQKFQCTSKPSGDKKQPIQIVTQKPMK